MLIISKFKDYYDYLTGIYGIDNKLVLDRRDNYNDNFPNEYLRFFIAGYIVEGLYQNNQFYYGESLKQFALRNQGHKIWLSKHYKRDYDKSIEVEFIVHETSKKHEWIYLEPVKDINNKNIEENCTILLEEYWSNGELYKNPILKNYNLGSFIKAETIYQWLTEWLSNQISNKEKLEPMTNEEKILSKGFDKITSFRNM